MKNGRAHRKGELPCAGAICEQYTQIQFTMMHLLSRLVASSVLMLFSLSAYAIAGGFKGVPFDSGAAHITSEAITGPISRAGGGVILRDTASCKLIPQELCNSATFAIVRGVSRSTIRLNGGPCAAKYVGANWLLKGAVDLVASETAVVYRNVDLLGEPLTEEIRTLARHNISPRKVFFVEVSSPLAKTKAGETLMTLDLLLTDPNHYAADRTYAAVIKQILDIRRVANWTWTDENAQSSFDVNCKNASLELRGNPDFTFLNKNKSIIPIGFDDQIRQLHVELFKDSIEFARVSAFFRYVRNNHPANWEQLKKTAAAIPRSPGDTPRIIFR